MDYGGASYDSDSLLPAVDNVTPMLLVANNRAQCEAVPV